jgi:hypothetical protein
MSKQYDGEPSIIASADRTLNRCGEHYVVPSTKPELDARWMTEGDGDEQDASTTPVFARGGVDAKEHDISEGGMALCTANTMTNAEEVTTDSGNDSGTFGGGTSSEGSSDAEKESVDENSWIDAQ